MEPGHCKSKRRSEGGNGKGRANKMGGLLCHFAEIPRVERETRRVFVHGPRDRGQDEKRAVTWPSLAPQSRPGVFWKWQNNPGGVCALAFGRASDGTGCNLFGNTCSPTPREPVNFHNRSRFMLKPGDPSDSAPAGPIEGQAGAFRRGAQTTHISLKRQVCNSHPVIVRPFCSVILPSVRWS